MKIRNSASCSNTEVSQSAVPDHDVILRLKSKTLWLGVSGRISTDLDLDQFFALNREILRNGNSSCCGGNCQCFGWNQYHSRRVS